MQTISAETVAHYRRSFEKYKRARPHAAPADLGQFLREQGYGEAHIAAALALEVAPSSRSGNDVDLLRDSSALYARLNAGHHDLTYGRKAADDPQPARNDVDVRYGGRLPGVNSPADYVRDHPRKTPTAPAPADDGAFFNDLAEVEKIYARANENYCGTIGQAKVTAK